jgi:hypothetical protein
MASFTAVAKANCGFVFLNLSHVMRTHFTPPLQPVPVDSKSGLLGYEASRLVVRQSPHIVVNSKPAELRMKTEHGLSHLHGKMQA